MRAEVHGFADVGEGDVGEPRSLQHPGHGRRIGEGERIRSCGSGRRSRGSGQGLADSDVPLVALTVLPDHHHQAPGRAQRPAGRSARPALPNATAGFAKNIVPNLLMARSKRFCGNG